jgi:VCBS repeat-containing protein
MHFCLQKVDKGVRALNSGKTIKDFLFVKKRDGAGKNVKTQRG